MGTAERRTEIMRVLFRRRYEKISNLAEEFGVSTRTILRDIEVLSISEPIYTQCGRYGGGVYVSSGQTCEIAAEIVLSKANIDGGAIYASSNSTLNVKNALIQGCSAVAGKGGAICLNGANFIAGELGLFDCSATKGGALFLNCTNNYNWCYSS